jgi:GNAT superfamily N-acetyltransferase
MNYAIRQAHEHEHTLLPDLEGSANALLDRAAVPRSPNTVSVNFIAAIARCGSVFVAANDIDNLPVGFLLAGFLDRAVYAFLLAVSEDHQRKGLGRRLMEEGCAYARREGAGAVSLSTFIDLPWGAPFFESLGFRQVPTSAWTPATIALS